MDVRLPLPTLLSHALIAFTIEFDNEAEHRLPHATTNYGRTPGAIHAPWLVSLVMWFNCMRFVDEKGITARDLEQLAGTETNLNGMTRWGYVRVEPDPSHAGPKQSRSKWLIRPKRGGRMAQEVWRPLLGEIENRWRERFGEAEVDRLRKSLAAVIVQFEHDLPDHLPILGYGLVTKERLTVRPKPEAPEQAAATLPLPALLSQVLLEFAFEFEGEAVLSLALSANVLRLLERETPVRDLPRLAGVSEEAIAMALSFLTKRGYAVAKTESRVKLIALTSKGKEARRTYLRLLPAIEARWDARFGKGTMHELRRSLEFMADARLLEGIEPYADGWRAKVERPSTLPHFPMILHRGGWPDGS